MPQFAPNNHRPLLCLAPCCLASLHVILPLCFRHTSVVSGPVGEPLSAVSHVNRGRRGQICHPRAALGHVISLPHLALSSTQVSGLHAEEADGEPEGAVLCGGAVPQGVQRSESEEFGADGGG